MARHTSVEWFEGHFYKYFMWHTACILIVAFTFTNLCKPVSAMQTDSLPFMQLGYGELYGDAVLSPDGKYLLTGTYIQRAILIELETGRVAQMYPSGNVTSCALSPDGETVITSSVGGTPRLFNRETGELTGTLSGHTADVGFVRFSPRRKQNTDSGL